MCNECEEMAKEGNLGLSGISALLSGKCPKETEKEELIIVEKMIG